MEGDLIHVGTPVSKTLQIQSVDESQEKAERIKGESIGGTDNIDKSKNGSSK